MPLLKQRTCFLGNKLHRKSYYQCDGICAVWRGLCWCFMLPLGDFLTEMELTLSWLQRTPLSMFLQNNNSYFLILTKDLNVCSSFFQNKTKACYKENRNIQHSFCLIFHVNTFCWLSLIYVARWNTKRNVYRNWQYYLNMQESLYGLNYEINGFFILL